VPGDFEVVGSVKIIPFLVLTFSASLILTGFLAILSRQVHIGLDKETGVQKFHTSPTSRLGGVSIFLGLLLGLVSLYNSKTSSGLTLMMILLSGTPVFLGGLLEDLTHKVPAIIRLALALLSASCFFYLMGFGVERTDVLIVDWLLKSPVMVYLISLLVIAGFTHSVNIIDGFNGLASGQILLMLGSLSYISNYFGQEDLLVYSLLLFAVTFGFFCWNWPLGKIFLGDSGSYLLGFNVVVIGLSLVHRLPNLSPFSPILIGLYPLVETLFSIYRRVLISRVSMNKPDSLHLHSLIFKRVIMKKYKFQNPSLNNSMVSIFFFIPFLVFDVVSLNFINTPNALLILFFSFIAIYIYIFRSIVKFKFKYKTLFLIGKKT
jgi:UDP-N-acetylmuramyl pentapeptide phosphotransferase/UDP-N-acetylglucosamine-1-phosphate transferase